MIGRAATGAVSHRLWQPGRVQLTLDGPAVVAPEALRAAHVATAVGASVRLSVTLGADWGDEPAVRVGDVVLGAGFVVVAGGRVRTGRWTGIVERQRTLPDTVGPGLRLLMVGLNPSVIAADAGFGFASPSNRYWRAAVAAGVVSATHDPPRARAVDGVGMTDLVKRATPKSAEITGTEYRAGAARIDRLAAWLQPGALCMVGLEGWRAAVDRKARPGWQSTSLGGRPTYVMPSTSGLNASVRVDDLVAHLRRATAGPDV